MKKYILKIIIGFIIFLNIIPLIYMYVLSQGLTPSSLIHTISLAVPLINIGSFMYLILSKALSHGISSASLDKERLNMFINVMKQINISMSSLDDIEKILNTINKTILDIMKADYCSIFLYDESAGKFKRMASNIKDPNLFALLQNDVNSYLFNKLIDKDDVFLSDCGYKSGQIRNISSGVSIPVRISGYNIGVVLVEFTRIYKSDDNSIQILNILGSQVGNILKNSNSYRKMHFAANMDNLTKVYNRHSLDKIIDNEYRNALSNKDDLSLVMFDIDNFKKCNDTYGHLFGDKVLIELAKCVQKSIRGADVIGRFGGEEFVILLPSTNLENAYYVADKIREKITQLDLQSDQGVVHVSASFGVCNIYYTENQKDLITKADIALYVAKRTGKNKVVAYTEELANIQKEKK